MTNVEISRDVSEVLANLGSLNRRFSGKSVILTGAAGFLGCHFTHYFCALNDSQLLAEPCRIFAYDSFIRGTPDWVTEIGNRPDVTFEKLDVTRAFSYPAADFVVHAASIASPMFYRRFPLETMDANVMGLRHLLEHATATQVESVLFFSTSEIYGDPDSSHIPTSEDYRGNVSCTGPRACYDESKRYGETLAVTFWQAKGVPVKTVRPFNNYGPGLLPGDKRALPDFFSDVLADRDLVLFSDGRATRTFCYIADAITGYLLALLSHHNGEAFNIGADAPEISMLDLARRVIEISRKPLQVKFATSVDPNYLSDNPQRRCPSINKARRQLNYQPKVALSEGLERMWQYYRSLSTASSNHQTASRNSK